MNTLNSNDSDSDDDFMSDKFLLPNPATINLVIKKSGNHGSGSTGGGGLIHDRKLKRKLEIEEQRKKSNKKSIAVMEKEQLELGLSTAINPSDKIYKMMGKMGYKPGQSLGKVSSSSSSKENSTGGGGIMEPIGIQVKTDRYGFGRRETAMERLQEYRNKIACKAKQQSSLANQSIDTFRKNLINKSNAKLMECDLRRCQLTCEGLDAKENIKIPDMKFFWPNRNIKKDDDDDNDSSATVEDDTVDKTKANDGNADGDDDEDEGVDEEEYELYDQLEMLVHYLRNAYLYCYWCAIQYTDDMDLKSNCPGTHKDDHDLD